MSKPEGFKFDNRVRARMLGAESLTQAQLDTYLAELPDLADEAESLSAIAQPAVVDTVALAEQERLALAGRGGLSADVSRSLGSYFGARPAVAPDPSPPAPAADWVSALSAVASAPRSPEWRAPESEDPAASALGSVLASRFAEAEAERSAVEAQQPVPSPEAEAPEASAEAAPNGYAPASDMGSVVVADAVAEATESSAEPAPAEAAPVGHELTSDGAHTSEAEAEALAAEAPLEASVASEAAELPGAELTAEVEARRVEAGSSPQTGADPQLTQPATATAAEGEPLADGSEDSA